jgi:hypothetical protein
LRSDVVCEPLPNRSLGIDRISLSTPSAWAHYDTARPGSIRLLPRDDQLRSLRMDYERMQGMFFATPPTFDAILERLRVLENLINVGR